MYKTLILMALLAFTVGNTVEAKPRKPKKNQLPEVTTPVPNLTRLSEGDYIQARKKALAEKK